MRTLLAVLLLAACTTENAGVVRAREDAARREAAEVARLKAIKQELAPVVGESVSGMAIVRALANFGETCVLLIDPADPAGCGLDGLPGTCAGTLFAMHHGKWGPVGTGTVATLVFPEHCHFGITSGHDFRRFDDLSRPE